MQSVATISVNETNVYPVLEQKIQDEYLTLFSGDQKTIDSIIIHSVWVSPCFIDKVIDQNVIRIGGITRVQKGVVPSDLSRYFNINEKFEIFWLESLFGFIK